MKINVLTVLQIIQNERCRLNLLGYKTRELKELKMIEDLLIEEVIKNVD